MYGKLFKDAELKPGETKKGILVFEKFKAGEYKIRAILPKMLAGENTDNGPFAWEYAVILQKK